MIFKMCTGLFAIAISYSAAAAQADPIGSHIAFGDAYGNTKYEIIDKTSACGYGDGRGGAVIRVLASPEFLTLNFPPQPGAYMSFRTYSVMHYGEVSAATEGVSRGYRSPYEFQARESHRPPYSKDGPITLTEEFFVLDQAGLLTHTKSVNGVEETRCRYQKL